MNTGLLYSIDERYKNKNLIVDYEHGEIIDPESGVVIEDHLIVDIPSIRASDYAEWESKRQHEVLIEERDRRLRSIVYSVGKRINAPSWLCEDVLMFLKSAVRVRSNLVLGRNTSFSISNEKLVLATFYAIAKKRGLVSLAEAIGKMKCNGGTPCYLSRRRKDKEFHRYMSLVLKLWFTLHRNSGYIDEVKSYIRYFIEAIRRVNNNGLDIVRVVNKATELLSRCKNRIGIYRPRNLAVALLIKSINDIYGDSIANNILRFLARECRINESSLRNILRRLSHLENNGGE